VARAITRTPGALRQAGWAEVPGGKEGSTLRVSRPHPDLPPRAEEGEFKTQKFQADPKQHGYMKQRIANA